MRTSPAACGRSSSTRPERLLCRRMATAGSPSGQRGDVRHPRRIVRRALGEVVYAGALVALAVGALPVGVGAREPRVVVCVAHLGNAPEPPVVVERALDPAAVGELEVDVVDRA